MEKCFNRTQKNMKSLVLALLLMGAVIGVIGVANAAPTQPPLPTSYWGSVRIAENGSLMPNTLITVLDAAGNGIASATSNSDGSYLVIVPWDDTATTQDEGVVSGETITFTAPGKTVTSRVIDAQGTNNNLNLDVPTTTTTTNGGGGSSGGGGGGGGGGVVSGEQFANIEKTETRENSLLAGKPVTYKYTPPEGKGGIYEIAATGKESENDISIRVELLAKVSSLVKEPAPGTVYNYVNIWAGTKKIQEALIKFKVENSWIASKGVASSEVKMLKWDGSKWIVLPTTEKSKDATHTYYEARTESFSSFAVSVVKEVAAITETPGVTVTGTPAITPKATTTVAATPPVKTPGIPPWMTMVVIAAASYFILKKDRKNKKN